MQFPIEWQSACETHTGVRRDINEDSLFISPEIGLWVVADGMGGHDAGDFASQAIVNALSQLPGQDTLSELLDRVDDRLIEVNDLLRDHARSHCGGNTVGSTVVTMLAKGNVGVVLWAGDSRLYRLRAGMLEQITRDHNPIVDLLEEGLISEHTALSKDTNIITRAVGGQDDLVLDIAVFDVLAEDTFLLCSDGLYRELSHQEMSDFLEIESLADSVKGMLELSLERGARDNVSIVVSRPDRLQ